MSTDASKPHVVVSLTSFPKAIPYAVKAIQSILEGSVLPDKIVLYLNLSEFGDRTIPEVLTNLSNQNPIFEIRTCDLDIRSYLKLIPALTDFPESVIITVDDDIAYHPHLLRKLLRMHSAAPDAVIAHRVRRISTDKPYRRWRKYHWYDFLLKKTHRGFYNLQTGVGGVLYPPHSLKSDMLDPAIFMKLAPTTDDIWFWAAAVANHTPVVPVPFGYNKPRELNKPRSISLMTKNYKGGTDRNAAALAAIIEHYPQLRELTNNDT